jgi:ribonuclease PH
VALYQAFQGLVDADRLKTIPMTGQIAAISCGLYKDTAVLDLDYAEDSNAQVDTNFVLTAEGHFVEIQGTAEDKPFPQEDFDAMLSLARKGVSELAAAQCRALGIEAFKKA